MTTTTAMELRDGAWTVPAGDQCVTFRVRTLAVRTVRGTLTIERGTVTVAGGRPVAAEGTLAAASITTGIAKRDEHLCGEQFLHATAHPRLLVRALRFEPADGGWTVPAIITVAGAEAPITLHARRLPDPATGAVRVHITGEFDRTTTRIRAPRFMVGHRVAVEAELTLIRR
jgi:polyisoprenoid-binding protein YceI